MKISVISPVYKSPNSLEELVFRIIKSLEEITDSYEIILIDDGCPLNSWKHIRELCAKNDRIKGIKLSRNFGQYYATTAGMDISKGDWVVIIDCDLQDEPSEIVNLYNHAISGGYDIVLAARRNRQDRFIKKFLSRNFYKTLSFLSGLKFDYEIANYGIYRRKVIDSMNSMREPLRFFPGQVKWVGFKSDSIVVKHNERPYGSSAYSISKLLELAFNVIIGYSNKPLKIIIKLGFVMIFVSVVIILKSIYEWLLGVNMFEGYTTLIISIWFLCGLLMATLGVVGIYIGKIFEGIKNRPLYFVDERLNL